MNSNRNGFNKGINELGLNGVQLISGKHESCVISLLYGGYKFDRLANFNSSDAYDLLENIKQFGAEEAYRLHASGNSSTGVKSVCKQKVNDAHGRTHAEIIRNAEAQNGTYADRFANIQFYHQPLEFVLKQYCKIDCDIEFPSVFKFDCQEYDNFIKTYTDVIQRGGMKDVYAYIAKNCIVVDNKVWHINNLIEVIDKWISENQLPDFTKEQKVKALRGFEKMYNLQAV